MGRHNVTKSVLLLFRAKKRPHQYLYLSACASSQHASTSKERFKTFLHRELIVDKCEPDQLKRKPDTWDGLKFGHVFTDHWLHANWSQENGWDKPVISQLKPISLHPAAKVFHYGNELFEGMKAFRGVDNKIRLFTPELNLKRMFQSCKRAALPTFDADQFMGCLIDLIRIDVDWVPTTTTSSLYIRPTLIGIDPTLGVSVPKFALLYVLLTPVSAYYSTGFKPIALYADPQYCRAWPGGAGAFKMGSNYAPGLIAQQAAVELNCQNVLWLFGEDEIITEAGTMNIFVVWINENKEKELITPPLGDGLILPGVTRAGLLRVCREWREFKVSERNFSMRDIRKAYQEKRLLEMFASGTAAIVSPVELLKYRKKDGSFEEIRIPTMDQKPQSVMQRCYDTLNDIQYGRLARPDLAPVILE